MSMTKEQYIWKAKHQRGLTDEQINYFLERDSRYDLLPYYSLCCKRLGCERALEEVIKQYGSDSKQQEIGKYGYMRLSFLKNHQEEKYAAMMIEGTLQKHLEDTQRTAQERVQLLTAQMAEKEGVNETLKAQDQMKWVQMMNNIKNRAEEIVTKEVIYS